MKKFLCSIICSSGIIGGTLYVDQNYITYKSNKLTINKKFRCVKLPINQIYSLTWNQRIFNVATFKIISGEEYKFIIFNKKGFTEFFDSVKNFN